MADVVEEGSCSEKKSLPDNSDTMEEEEAESGDDIYEVEKIVGMTNREVSMSREVFVCHIYSEIPLNWVTSLLSGSFSHSGSQIFCKQCR